MLTNYAKFAIIVVMRKKPYPDTIEYVPIPLDSHNEDGTPKPAYIGAIVANFQARAHDERVRLQLDTQPVDVMGENGDSPTSIDAEAAAKSEQAFKDLGAHALAPRSLFPPYK